MELVLNCPSRNHNYLVFAFAAIRFAVTVPGLRNAPALQAAELISLATWETAAVGLILAVLAVHKGVAHLRLSMRMMMVMMMGMMMTGNYTCQDGQDGPRSKQRGSLSVQLYLDY